MCYHSSKVVSKVFLKLQLQEGTIFTYVITYFKNFCSRYFMRQEPSRTNKILFMVQILRVQTFDLSFFFLNGLCIQMSGCQ